MDRTDMLLAEALEENSRISYAELARKANLSVNSVHKRIQSLIDLGCIQSFYTILGPAVERYIIATAFGPTTSKDLCRTIDEIGRDEHTSQVVVATNDFIYPQWYLHDISELDDFIAFAKDTAKIESPQVVFRTVPPPVGHEDVRLSGLDYRIVNAFLEDSRRPVNEVARELGVSPKTVNRRLGRMQRKGAIVHTVFFIPSATPDIFSFFHMRLGRDVNRRDFSAYLLEKYSDHLQYVQAVDNLPDLLVGHVWTKTMKDLKKVRDECAREEGLDDLFVNVYYDSRRFETWREDLVRKRAAQAARRA